MPKDKPPDRLRTMPRGDIFKEKRGQPLGKPTLTECAFSVATGDAC